MKKKLVMIIIFLLATLVVSSIVLADTDENKIWLNTPFLRIWDAIHRLQSAIENLSLTPGPIGPAGPQGPQGPAGPPGSGDSINMVDCIRDYDCFDNNICTDESCALTGCIYTFNSNSCDDNNPLTQNDLCQWGICQGLTNITTNNSGNHSGNNNNSENNSTNENNSSDSGFIIITEFMSNPEAVSDSYGEWFEIYNKGPSQVNLFGWEIKDSGSDSYVFSEDWILGPQTHAVLCKNKNSSINGGIFCDLGYSSMTLGNTADAIIIIRNNGTISDAITYDFSLMPWKNYNLAGYSIQLNPDNYNSIENDDGINWCNAYDELISGDWGTPGIINADCQE
jgi:hypothetical protein